MSCQCESHRIQVHIALAVSDYALLGAKNWVASQGLMQENTCMRMSML